MRALPKWLAVVTLVCCIYIGVNTSLYASLRASQHPELQPAHARVDVVIAVHDALPELQILLSSLEKWTLNEIDLFLVNDRSALETTAFLLSYARTSNLRVVVDDLAKHGEEGYSFAVNRGVSLGSNRYVVILNSDTVVTEGWLAHMLAVAKSHERVGIVGILSNAASYQSIPNVTEVVHDRATGRTKSMWSKNPLPDGWTIDGVARAVRHLALPTYPELPFANGFCMLVKREVFSGVGLLDTSTFPYGYGEENDLVLRAKEGGWKVLLDDGAYIFHFKTRSFTTAEKERLAPAARVKLLAKHGRANVEEQEDRMRHVTEKSLQAIRDRITFAFQFPDLFHGSRLRILFLLPSSAVGGGSTSVVQEALRMQSFGVTVRIALWDTSIETFSAAFPDAAHMFFPWPKHLKTSSQQQAMQKLISFGSLFDVVIATIWISVPTLVKMWQTAPTFLPAYYVQDYEPLFYAPTDARYNDAMETYAQVTAIGGLLYCKSDWLIEQLQRRHGISAVKVPAGIEPLACKSRRPSMVQSPVILSAMLRPSTPRRNPLLTLNVLLQLKHTLDSNIEVVTFGCSSKDLQALSPSAHPLPIQHLGLLNRSGISSLFERSNIFLDLSQWQAYGRSAAEAMTCGSIAVVTDNGGASEFIDNGYNGFLVNNTDVGHVVEQITRVVTNPQLLSLMQTRALQLRSDLRIERAVLQRLRLFMKYLVIRFDSQKFTPWPQALLGQ